MVTQNMVTILVQLNNKLIETNKYEKDGYCEEPEYDHYHDDVEEQEIDMLPIDSKVLTV